MSPVSLRDKLASILKDLESTDPEIEASAIIRTDGLLMASNFRTNLDRNLVAAMNAAILNIANRATSELKKGTLQELIIRTDKGIITLVNSGKDAILSTISKADANLGLLLFEMKKSAKKVAEVLS
ncbi:MAG: roadblock/LC7 domain-containing protein [Candidatus Asgardarchaeia archaeon]